MSNATDTANQDLPKVVITLGVLAGALIIGLLIAKLADYLYERSSVRDDASDISEHTRELLKTQLELMRMGRPKDKKDDKKDNPEAEKETAAKAMGVWSSKVKAKGKLNPIPESTEAVEGDKPANADKSKQKTGTSISFKASDGPKKDDVKKYKDAVKVWNEVEKTSEAKTSNNKSPAKTTENGESSKAKDTPKSSPKKGTAKDSPSKKANESTKDDEFDVPENIAAPSKANKGTEKKKSSSNVIIPENLSKNADIRPITPAKVDENMPGYMRPKTPFTQRNFSRYNGTTDPTRSSNEKPSSQSTKS